MCVSWDRSLGSDTVWGWEPGGPTRSAVESSGMHGAGLSSLCCLLPGLSLTEQRASRQGPGGGVEWGRVQFALLWQPSSATFVQN